MKKSGINNIAIQEFYYICYITYICSQRYLTEEIIKGFVCKTELVNDQSKDAESFLPHRPNKNLARWSSCGLSWIARFPRNCWRLDKFITEWIARPTLMFVAQFISLRFSLVRKGVWSLNVIPSNALNEHSCYSEPRGCQRTRQQISIRIMLTGLLCRGCTNYNYW